LRGIVFFRLSVPVAVRVYRVVERIETVVEPSYTFGEEAFWSPTFGSMLTAVAPVTFQWRV
jgi:hypothetical protein